MVEQNCWPPVLCWNCFGGHWQSIISQRLDHTTSTVLSGELNNHLLTNQFVVKSFLFVLHSYTEISAVTKLAVSEFDQKTFLWKSTKCTDMHSFNTNNATFFFGAFCPQNVAKKMTWNNLVITVKNRTDIVFDMLPSWSIYIDVYKMCKNRIKNTKTSRLHYPPATFCGIVILPTLNHDELISWWKETSTGKSNARC